MQESTTPKWFLIIAIIALIWNMLGLMAFVSHIMITPEMIAELPDAEQALYRDIPIWATLAFAIAVVAGTLGCVLLLMKKALAKPMFIASLIAVLIQDFHAFIMIDSLAVYGTAGLIMPMLVIIIAVALMALSHRASHKGWLK